MARIRSDIIRCTVLAALIFATSITPVWSETLAEALASAYMGNPQLRAERARQRATDELVPQAKSGWRPQISAQGTVGREYSDTDGATGQFSDNRSRYGDPIDVSIALEQPVFRGFRTVEGIKQAEAQVRAGEQELLATEQRVLFSGVQAFLNVQRDRRIVAYQQSNLKVVQQELNAASTRFSVGEVTRTDVAQARSRVGGSMTLLARAKADLDNSNALFIRVIGHAPQKLTPPKGHAVPKTMDDAIATADKLNPQILAAAYSENSAIHAVKVATGALLPELSLRATASQRWNSINPSDDVKNDRTQRVVVQGVLNVPIYQSGREYSQVREQKQIASQRKLEILEARRVVRQAVEEAWALMVQSRSAVASTKIQVAAAILAQDGMQQEYLAGARTTIDVLDSEADVTIAQIEQVRVETDTVLSTYQVLAAMGKLTARNLELKVDLYNPEKNAARVSDKFFGTDVKTVK